MAGKSSSRSRVRIVSLSLLATLLAIIFFLMCYYVVQIERTGFEDPSFYVKFSLLSLLGTILQIPGFFLVAWSPTETSKNDLKLLGQRVQKRGEFRSRRQDQLGFMDLSRQDQNQLVDLCLKITVFMTRSDTSLKALRGKSPWLEEFTAPVLSSDLNLASAMNLGQSLRAFDLDPDGSIQHLIQYEGDVHLRDVIEEHIHQVSQMDGDAMQCWAAFLERMAEVIEDSQGTAATTTLENDINVRKEQLRDARKKLKDLEIADHPFPKATALSVKFLNRSIKYDQAEDVKIERSWYPERRRAAAQVLKELGAAYKSFDSMINLIKLVFDDDRRISAVHDNLLIKTRAFAHMLSGKQAANFAEAIQILRATSIERRRWSFLLDELQRLRDQNSYHEQIITCLQYRHVLECLPNKDVIKRELKLTPSTGATSIWQHTWKLAVKAEVKIMLQNHINQINGAAGKAPSTGAASGARAATTASVRPLTSVLENDFRYWALANRQSIVNMAGKAKVGGVPYQTWPSYIRGDGLYNELSSNIHSYGKSYEVKDHVWLRSERMILKWLRPKVDQNTGEVDWSAEWSSKGLPP